MGNTEAAVSSNTDLAEHDLPFWGWDGGAKRKGVSNTGLVHHVIARIEVFSVLSVRTVSQ